MRDVLTEGEIYRLASMKPADVRTMLQAAARLGAERERERAARALTSADSLAECVEEFQAAINTEALARECAERDDAGDADHETLETATENLSESWRATDRAIHYYRKHAAAIRSGEEG
jgi:hypothetical protein